MIESKLKEARNCDNYKDKRRSFFQGYDLDKPLNFAGWISWQRFGNLLRHDLKITRAEAGQKFEYYWSVLSERNLKKYGVLHPYKRCGGIRDEISSNKYDLVQPYPWLQH